MNCFISINELIRIWENPFPTECTNALSLHFITVLTKLRNRAEILDKRLFENTDSALLEFFCDSEMLTLGKYFGLQDTVNVSRISFCAKNISLNGSLQAGQMLLEVAKLWTVRGGT
jgi:hypothetical protein